MTLPDLTPCQQSLLRDVRARTPMSASKRETIITAKQLQDRGLISMAPGHVGPDGLPLWWILSTMPAGKAGAR